MKIAYINGQDSTARRERILSLFKAGELDVCIASTIADEGLDVPNIAYLILAGGGKAGHRQVQRIGRGQRVSGDKQRLVVLDFMDKGKYLSRHSKERLKTYQNEEAYTVVEMDADEFEELLDDSDSGA